MPFLGWIGRGPWLWYHPAAMRRIRSFFLLLALVSVLSAGTATAQELPKYTPATAEAEPGGYCAPWHRCIAYLGLGMAGVTVLMFGLGFVFQSRGFDRLEHKQGNPEGVSTSK